MKRTSILTLTFVGVAALLIGACGSAASTDNVVGDASGEVSTESSPSTPDNAENDGSGKPVVFYSTEAAMPDIADLYMDTHPGTEIQIINISSGEGDARVLAEADNPQADVQLSGGDPSHSNPELYRPYADAVGGENIDPRMLDDEYAIPIMFYTTMYAYNADALGDIEPPSSWADLARPEFKGQISIGDPAKSGAAYKCLASIYEAGGWDLVREIAPNLVISDSSLGPVQALADGEAMVGLQLEVGIYKVADGTRVVPVYPTEGQIVHTGPVYLVANSPNQAGADDFVKWLLSPEAQEFMSSENPGMRSTTTDSQEPGNVAPLSDLTITPLPDAAVDRDAFLAEWESIISTI